MNPASTKTAFSGVGFFTHKPGHGENLASCQDKAALGDEFRMIVVADGATTSFRGGDWAGFLVESLAQNPPKDAADLAWLELAKDKWKAFLAELLKKDETSSITRSRIQLLEPGAATFVAVRLTGSGEGDGKIQVMACGDSCVLVCREGKITYSAPKKLPSEFNNNPPMVNSNCPPAALEAQLFRDEFELQAGDTVFFATDALAKLLLTPGKDILEKCLQLKDPAQFRAFIADQRAISLEDLNDDVTLVRVTAGLDHQGVEISGVDFGASGKSDSAAGILTAGENGADPGKAKGFDARMQSKLEPKPAVMPPHPIPAVIPASPAPVVPPVTEDMNKDRERKIKTTYGTRDNIRDIAIGLIFILLVVEFFYFNYTFQKKTEAPSPGLSQLVSNQIKDQLLVQFNNQFREQIRHAAEAQLSQLNTDAGTARGYVEEINSNRVEVGKAVKEIQGKIASVLSTPPPVSAPAVTNVEKTNDVAQRTPATNAPPAMTIADPPKATNTPAITNPAPESLVPQNTNTVSKEPVLSAKYTKVQFGIAQNKFDATNAFQQILDFAKKNYANQLNSGSTNEVKLWITNSEEEQYDSKVFKEAFCASGPGSQLVKSFGVKWENNPEKKTNQSVLLLYFKFEVVTSASDAP